MRGEKVRNRHRQRGLTMTGFIFTAIVVVAVVMIGFRILPSYIEYFSVQKVLSKTLEDSKQGFSLYQFRRDFDLKASADYIDSVTGGDIEVAKDGNNLVATATWTRTLHLVGNVSLLLEFEATAKK
jgi:hypothetical protein